MRTFKIYFNNNRGSWAIDAIAETVDGRWYGTVDNMGFIDVEDGNADYLKEILEADDNVTEYSERY